MSRPRDKLVRITRRIVAARIVGEAPARIEPSAALPGEEVTAPAAPSVCLRCHTRSLVPGDGCFVCLNCGESLCA